jgi:hypothetical protein
MDLLLSAHRSGDIDPDLEFLSFLATDYEGVYRPHRSAAARAICERPLGRTDRLSPEPKTCAAMIHAAAAGGRNGAPRRRFRPRKIPEVATIR